MIRIIRCSDGNGFHLGAMRGFDYPPARLQTLNTIRGRRLVLARRRETDQGAACRVGRSLR